MTNEPLDPATLEAVARAFVAKLDECIPHIDNAFLMEMSRGRPYSGPNYAKELADLRTILDALQPEGGE